MNGQGYETLEKAVDEANAGDTVTLTANSAEKVNITKKLTITANMGISFTGSLIFQKSAEGSKVQGLTFNRPEPTQTDFETAKEYRWTVNPIEVKSASDITVTGNTFNSPSALFKGKEWQYNGVWVDYGSSNITISKNTFNLGRLNDTNGTGEIAVDANANSAINLVGKGPKNIVIDSNTVNVTAPDKSATAINASINLLIAMGNSNNATGISNVTVSNNTYNGANDKDANTRFVGLSDVHNITFTGNTVSNTKYGIGQSVWRDNTNLNTGVTLGSGNTFKNVSNAFTAETDKKDQAGTAIGASVEYADGNLVDYGWIKDAVDAVNNSNGNATLYLLKSVDSHNQYTFSKKVEVTVPAKLKGSINFNGSLIFNASDSKVNGINFYIDSNDITKNVSVSNQAKNVEISDNTFTIPSLNINFQPNSVWLENGANGTKIVNNKFKLGRALNNSAVGINFVGGTANNTIKNTTVNKNTVIFTEDAQNYPQDGHGDAAFAVANGNTNGQYGVQNVIAEDNTINGTRAPKDIAVYISDVKDLQLINNEITGTYMAVSNSGTSSSTDLIFKSNVLKDISRSTIIPAVGGTITYGGGKETNIIARTGYKNTPVYVNGLAFVGWYEQDGKTLASKESDTSYAKLVPIEDAYEFKFLGGSLRVDKNQATDTANLRFGYKTKLVDKDLKLDKTNAAGWEYTIPSAGSGLAKAVNPHEEKDGIVNNAVFTGVPKKLYGTQIRVRMYLQYVTPDGTTVRAYDSVEQSRSVNDVAKGILKDPEVKTNVKNFAQGLLNAGQTTK